MFAPRISLSLLAQQCRSLSSMFDSGVPLLKALNVLATKTANAQSRNAMQDVVRRIKKGEDLTAAFRAQGNYFPPPVLRHSLCRRDICRAPALLRQEA